MADIVTEILLKIRTDVAALADVGKEFSAIKDKVVLIADASLKLATNLEAAAKEGGMKELLAAMQQTQAQFVAATQHANQLRAAEIAISAEVRQQRAVREQATQASRAAAAEAKKAADIERAAKQQATQAARQLAAEARKVALSEKEAANEAKRMADEQRKAAESASKNSFGAQFVNNLKIGFGIDLARRAAEGIVSIVRSMKDAVATGIEFNAMLETQAVAFETLLGSREEAESRMRDLIKLANTTPFEVSDVVQASRIMQALAGSEFAAGEGIRLVGDSAAAVGRQFAEVAFWMGRVAGALKDGIPMGEAILRLTEMGLITGKARQRLMELSGTAMSTGEAMDAMQEIFGKNTGAMAKQANTFNGMMSTMRDTFRSLAGEFARPVFEAFKGALRRILEDLGAIPFAVDKVVNNLKDRTEDLRQTVSKVTTANLTATTDDARSTLAEVVSEREAVEFTLKRLRDQQAILDRTPQLGLPAGVVTTRPIIDGLIDVERQYNALIVQEKALRAEIIPQLTQAQALENERLARLDAAVNRSAFLLKNDEKITEEFQKQAEAEAEKEIRLQNEIRLENKRFETERDRLADLEVAHREAFAKRLAEIDAIRAKQAEAEAARLAEISKIPPGTVRDNAVRTLSRDTRTAEEQRLNDVKEAQVLLDRQLEEAPRARANESRVHLTTIAELEQGLLKIAEDRKKKEDEIAKSIADARKQRMDAEKAERIQTDKELNEAAKKSATEVERRTQEQLASDDNSRQREEIELARVMGGLARDRAAIESNRLLTEEEKRRAILPLLQEENRLLDEKLQKQNALILAAGGDAKLELERTRDRDATQGDINANTTAIGESRPRSVSEEIGAGLTELVDSFGTKAQQIAAIFTGPIKAAVNGVRTVFQGLLGDTDFWTNKLGTIPGQIIGAITAAISEMFAAWIAGRVRQSAVHLGLVASEGAAEVAAKTPGALLSSISSFGVAVVLGVAALAGVLGAFASGGLISGPGGPKDDRVPILASNGEFMVQQPIVDKFGTRFFRKLNAGVLDLSALPPDIGTVLTPPQFAEGGAIGRSRDASVGSAERGPGAVSLHANFAVINTRQQLREFQQREGAKYSYDFAKRRQRRA